MYSTDIFWLLEYREVYIYEQHIHQTIYHVIAHCKYFFFVKLLFINILSVRKIAMKSLYK